MDRKTSRARTSNRTATSLALGGRQCHGQRAAEATRPLLPRFVQKMCRGDVRNVMVVNVKSAVDLYLMAQRRNYRGNEEPWSMAMDETDGQAGPCQDLVFFRRSRLGRTVQHWTHLPPNPENCTVRLPPTVYISGHCMLWTERKRLLVGIRGKSYILTARAHVRYMSFIRTSQLPQVGGSTFHSLCRCREQSGDHRCTSLKLLNDPAKHTFGNNHAESMGVVPMNASAGQKGPKI